MPHKGPKEITRAGATINERRLQQIFVLWLLFTSGNDIGAIADNYWAQQIKPYLLKQGFDNPDGFLNFALDSGNQQDFNVIAGFLGSFTQGLWGGPGPCPMGTIDWILDMFPQ
jgi:hypothetical protein